MPGLTVTEKEHWKNRISHRIDKRIDAIAAEEPNFLEHVGREARERALRSLGLAELQAEQDRVERESAALDRREGQIKREQLARVRGVAVDGLEEYSAYQHDREVAAAIKKRADVHEDELLTDCERGRRILQLRQERENLLDTVWLATSPQHIKTLWSKLAELLGDEQTRLQREAMAIPSIED